MNDGIDIRNAVVKNRDEKVEEVDDRSKSGRLSPGPDPDSVSANGN